MDNKSYVYYPPKNPQFFFPKKEFKKFEKYYFPYSLKSKLFWVLFQKSKLIRNIFAISEKDIPLPIESIKRNLNFRNNNYNFFFNLGTQGEEQKATIIAIGANKSLFLKFAEKQKAHVLVRNEIKILQELQLQKTIVVPKLFNHKETNSFTMLVTEVMQGNKMTKTDISDDVMKCLLELPKVRPVVNNEFIETFAHGDFCPWNILVKKNGGLLLVDWEMAGYKPLGYDLFTYVFQTSFLLDQESSPQDVINNNKDKIETFFKTYKVENWKEYLTKFAMLKIKVEKQKKQSVLLFKYKQLLQIND